MHPILADRKRIVIYLAVWCIVGIVFSGWMYYILNGYIFLSLLITLPVILVYSQINLSAWYIVKAFPLEKTNIGKIVVLVIISSLLMSLLFVGLFIGWIFLLSQYIAIPQPNADQWLLYLLLNGLGEELYLVSLAIAYLFAAFEVSRSAERDSFELKLLAQSSELKALRMQINPHFLFNSLNSINALISQKPEKAREMTTLLADFFRKSLQFGSKETITLGEEISLLTNYLDIERIRFGARLSVEQKVDESVLPCLVPPLLLQPILENAVKYGISNSLENGIVRIVVEGKKERVFITVENTHEEEQQTIKGTGLGLSIVRKRLHTIFGGNSDVQIFREGNVFRVMLFFPVRK
jgi:two-component system sensor histidine kinase AlgZ